MAKIADEIRAVHPTVNIVVRASEGCAARIDPDRVEQVVSNLLANAVAHGDASQPIEVALTVRPEAVSLTILNQGTPVEPAFLREMFNPFARSAKTQGQTTGLGLGLYIAERITDAHRGKLSVESSAGSGTRFELTLPRSS